MSSYMLRAGDACSGSLGSCNDIQNKKDDAKPDLATIRDRNRDGNLAGALVWVNLVFANGAMADAESASNSAQSAARNAQADVASAVQDQRNGDAYYAAASAKFEQEKAAYSAYLGSIVAVMDADFNLKQADARATAAKGAADACQAEIDAADKCTIEAIQARCGPIIGAYPGFAVAKADAKKKQDDAIAAQTTAENAYKAAVAASKTAYETAHRVSAHVGETKERAEASKKEAEDGKKEAEDKKKAIEERKKKQEDAKKKIEDASKDADGAKDKVNCARIAADVA
jgi:chromosome segregation ATPase